MPAWVDRCLASVRTWADGCGHAYEHLGAEVLELAPGFVHDAAGRSVLPVTDVARLVLVRDRLAAGHERVVWLDADVLVWEGSVVDVEVDADVAVCAERWVTGAGGGGLQVLPWQSNAALSCRSVDGLLAATLDRVRAGDVRARSLGPDLLASVGPLPEVRGISVLSPHVVRDVPGAWDLLLDALPWPMGAANLCWSMAHHDDVVARCVSGLLGDR